MPTPGLSASLEIRMKPKSIRLFIKSYCGWCHEAMAWLDARNYTYEKLDVIEDPAAMKEMKQLTGQTSAPCMEVDGEVLADFGVDELEVFWKKLGYDL